MWNMQIAVVGLPAMRIGLRSSHCAWSGRQSDSLPRNASSKLLRDPGEWRSTAPKSCSVSFERKRRSPVKERGVTVFHALSG